MYIVAGANENGAIGVYGSFDDAEDQAATKRFHDRVARLERIHPDWKIEIILDDDANPFSFIAVSGERIVLELILIHGD